MRSSRLVTYQSEVVQCLRVWQRIWCRRYILGTSATPLPNAARRLFRITKPLSTMASFYRQSQYSGGSIVGTYDMFPLLAVIALTTDINYLVHRVLPMFVDYKVLQEVPGDVSPDYHGTARQAGHVSKVDNMTKTYRYNPHGVG